jgi:hypothetical protein
MVKLMALDIGAIPLIAPQLHQKIVRNYLIAPKVQAMQVNNYDLNPNNHNPHLS